MTDQLPWFSEMVDESNHVAPTLDDDLDDRLTFTPDTSLDTEAGTYASVDPDLIKKRKRAPGALQYENKVNDILTMGVVVTAGREGTVTDAAAILLHGDAVATAFGDLAAENDNTARVIDFLHGGTGNAASAAVMAALPLILQIVRNHEPQLETMSRINIPFTRKKIGFNVPSRVKIKISNNPILGGFTNEPDRVYSAAFSQKVVDDLKTNLKVNVAAYRPRHRAG